MELVVRKWRRLGSQQNGVVNVHHGEYKNCCNCEERRGPPSVVVGIGGHPEILLELAPLHLLQVLPLPRHQREELLLVQKARLVRVSCRHH